ncbi:RNA polymerase sigma factor [Polyangium mundeleinium]|uniref:Sigma-70 family RNA polymerase sigma factor n=1 Tax=Polyangium mundeleinium TaxID=2995306 RepID=A0ABT5F3R3_9BACT|nr:sigma-70 family RNA polymerase sigma factor [Polyangium mundeleinium]MDC0748132.1 sigma-70 family RNA polymerase sigma factor [Polyangium mundeleinium]
MEGENQSFTRASFQEAWSQSEPQLRKLCFRWTGRDPEAARDALGTVAVLAMEELTRSSGEISNVRAWLTRLARNACVDIHRERAIKRRAIERMTVEGGLESAHVESPEAEQMRRELDVLVRRAIDGLPPGLAETAKLRLVEEEPYEDIAGELSLSPETVRKRIQDARTRLRHELSTHVDEARTRGITRRVESRLSTR